MGPTMCALAACTALALAVQALPGAHPAEVCGDRLCEEDEAPPKVCGNRLCEEDEALPAEAPARKVCGDRLCEEGQSETSSEFEALDSHPCGELGKHLMYGPTARETCVYEGMIPYLEGLGYVYAHPEPGRYVDCGERVLMVGGTGTRACVSSDIIYEMQKSGWSIARGTVGGVISHGTDCTRGVAVRTSSGIIHCTSEDLLDALARQGTFPVNGTITPDARVSWTPPMEQIRHGVLPEDVQCPAGWELILDPDRTLCIREDMVPIVEQYRFRSGGSGAEPAAPQIPPPARQVRDGVQLEHVRCAEGRVLLASPSHRPACVTGDLVERLTVRGYYTVEQKDPPARPDAVFPIDEKRRIYPAEARIPQDVTFESIMSGEGGMRKAIDRMLEYVGDSVVGEIEGHENTLRTELGNRVSLPRSGAGVVKYWLGDLFTHGERYELFFGMAEHLGLDLRGDESYVDGSFTGPPDTLYVAQVLGEGLIMNGGAFILSSHTLPYVQLGTWVHDPDGMRFIGPDQAYDAAMEYIDTEAVQEAMWQRCDELHYDHNSASLVMIHDRPVWDTSAGTCIKYNDDRPESKEERIKEAETIYYTSRLVESDAYGDAYGDRYQGRFVACDPKPSMAVPDGCDGFMRTPQNFYYYLYCKDDLVEACSPSYPDTWPINYVNVKVDAITGEPLYAAFSGIHKYWSRCHADSSCAPQPP